MSDICFRVENLDTHYGETQVLHDVTLDVREGEVFVIIGGSGSGKTTLLKHMAGLLHPTSGSIFYNGADITKLDEEQLAKVQQTIGIAFQSGGLFNSMSVADNVALPLREYGSVRDESLIHDIVQLKLSLVGLSGAQHKLPSDLSGGMRKRAGLARALALDPPVVFFDEPSAGLDPITAAGLDQLVRDLNRLLGTTFIIVTHELESIRMITDRLVMLDSGKVIFKGTIQEAKQTDVDRVRQFFERRPDKFIAAQFA